MLKKSNRLTSECFEKVYADGKSVAGAIGYMKIMHSDSCSGVACVAPQSEADSSVERTRIRRRGYAAVEQVFTDIPDNYGIIWFLDTTAINKDFDTLVDAFTDMVRQSRLSGRD